jgi:hypothetical protein
MLSLSNPSHHIPTKTPIGGDYNGMIIIAKPLQSSDPSPTKPPTFWSCLRLEDSSPHHRDATTEAVDDERNRQRQQNVQYLLQCLNEALAITDEAETAAPKKRSGGSANTSADVGVPEEPS